MLWTKQFSLCLCSVRFRKKEKEQQQQQQKRRRLHWKKKKIKSRNANKNNAEKKKKSHNAAYYCQFSTPNVLVSTLDPLCNREVWQQGAQHSGGGHDKERKRVWCVWRHLREQQKQPCCFGPFHRPDCTLHCIALAVSFLFLSLPSKLSTQTLTHMHTSVVQAFKVLVKCSHTCMSLYSIIVPPGTTTCLRHNHHHRRRHSCRLAVQSFEKMILGSCARSCVPPLDRE